MHNRINHVHLKCKDPVAAAGWFAQAFGFEVLSDETRALGDRLLRCKPANGDDITFVISSPRSDERIEEGSPNPRFGFDHFGVDSANLDADIARLEALGATVAEPPFTLPSGSRAAFMVALGSIRIELIQRSATK